MKFESQFCIFTAISLSFLFCLFTSQNINVFLHLILHLKCFPHTEFFQFEKIQVFQILLDFLTHYREFLFPLQFSPIASPTILATLCNHVLSLYHTADQLTIKVEIRNQKQAKSWAHSFVSCLYLYCCNVWLSEI